MFKSHNYVVFREPLTHLTIQRTWSLEFAGRCVTGSTQENAELDRHAHVTVRQGQPLLGDAGGHSAQAFTTHHSDSALVRMPFFSGAVDAAGGEGSAARILWLNGADASAAESWLAEVKAAGAAVDAIEAVGGVSEDGACLFARRQNV